MHHQRDTDPECFLRRVNLRVCDDLHEVLRTTAIARRMSMNELGTRILERYLIAQDPAPIGEGLRSMEHRHRENLERLRRRVPP